VVVAHDVKQQQGMKQFVAEVANIDVVQLLGYCSRKGELLSSSTTTCPMGEAERERRAAVAELTAVARAWRPESMAPASELGSKRLGNEELGKKRDVTENDCLRFVHSVKGGL
jgi:hypothetical protein